jgi:pimeloyl-ACP methyl ester carboxylesterase
VIFLPGIVMPAALRYGPLIAALGDSAQAVAKDLEVYAGDTPPPDYSVELEIEGIERAADEAGFDRFHVYGHSAGGAFALAYAATRPERLLSLALDEPGTDFSPEGNARVVRDIDEFASLPPAEAFRVFVASQLAPGVEPPAPPPSPSPEWMAKRPAGILAFRAAIERFAVSPEQLRAFDRPVYSSYGSLTHPGYIETSHRLAALFPDFTAEEYEGLHHFRTSHAAEPERVAGALRKLWARSLA